MDNQGSLVLVTGHTFGVRAFEGIFSARAFLDRKIQVPLMIGLDESHAAGTVGYTSLGRLATEQGVRYISTCDGRLSSLADRIRAARPDYILVIGWSHLVAEDILSIPSAGCIGMHPTMLPTGRGQASIPWTIIKDHKETALSVFFLVAAADAGPIIAQYKLAVRAAENSASLFYRIAHMHFTAGFELAEQIGDAGISARAQDEAIATRWPRRRPKDGEILETMTCREISLLVRALLGPYPRAFVWTAGEKVEIRGVEPATGSDSAAAGDAGRIRFHCRDGEVYLLRDNVPAAT